MNKQWIINSDAGRLPLAGASVDLTVCSPPYCDARLYLEGGKNGGIARGCVAWVEWMIPVILELQRVTRGPVIVIAAGVTRKRNYWPACEGLMWEWWKRGGDCQLYRPVFWHRAGNPKRFPVWAWENRAGKTWQREIEARIFPHPEG